MPRKSKAGSKTVSNLASTTAASSLPPLHGGSNGRNSGIQSQSWTVTSTSEYSAQKTNNAGQSEEVRYMPPPKRIACIRYVRKNT